MPRRSPLRPVPTLAKPLRLSVTAATGASPVNYLRRHIAAAHALLKPPLAELSIALVGDRRMTELHKQFLGIPGPTDVLTFPLEVDRRGRPLSGEVVVCVPEARRRGAAEGTGLKEEVLLYALHGLLHLCGFDDRTRSGFAAMHRTEDAILTSLGIGPVFSGMGNARGKATAATNATHGGGPVERRRSLRPRRRTPPEFLKWGNAPLARLTQSSAAPLPTAASAMLPGELTDVTLRSSGCRLCFGSRFAVVFDAHLLPARTFPGQARRAPRPPGPGRPARADAPACQRPHPGHRHRPDAGQYRHPGLRASLLRSGLPQPRRADTSRRPLWPPS